METCVSLKLRRTPNDILPPMTLYTIEQDYLGEFNDAVNYDLEVGGNETAGG